MIEKLMANKKSFANPISPVTMPYDKKNQTTGPVLMPEDRKNQTTRPVLKPYDKMGGGMMQKPMGYKTGGGYDLGTPGKLRDYSSKFNKDGVTYKNPRAMGPEESPRLKKLIKKKESRDKALKTTKSVLKTLSSVGSPMSAGVSSVYKIAKNMRSKDRLTERDIETARSAVGMGSKNRPIKKDHSSRNPNPKTPKMMNMGGMMMQRPMGYKHGTSVKAKCKLGRNKPTKIT
jgi:hypothetical protein